MISSFDRYQLVMAEIALGGLHVAVTRTSPAVCRHEQTLTTITCGLQRIVCERCGHVSVRYIRPLAGPIDRRRFARQADIRAERGLHMTHVIEIDGTPYPRLGVFSPQERVALRNRFL